MQTLLNPASQPAHDSFVEKKSEFIGDACHIDSMDDALLFVESIREMHPKSRHVAYAALYTDELGRLMERMGDDGEPSGTAGKPILDVLRANDLTDCVVTVTRYFGGILLGSGGLIRAYATGAAMAVKAARLACIVRCQIYRVPLSYTQLGNMRQLLSVMQVEETDAQYTDTVTLTVAVPEDRTAQFESRIRETFNASVVPEPLTMMSQPVPVE